MEIRPGLMKIAIFRVVTTCGLQTGRSFKGAETSVDFYQNTRRNIPAEMMDFLDNAVQSP
jgi:hypothetical protein